MSSTEHHKKCCKRTRNFTFLFIEKIYSSNFNVQRYQSCLKDNTNSMLNRVYFWSGMDFVQMHLRRCKRWWVNWVHCNRRWRIDDRSLFLIVTFLRPMTNLLNSMHCQSTSHLFCYLSLSDWLTRTVSCTLALQLAVVVFVVVMCVQWDFLHFSQPSWLLLDLRESVHNKIIITAFFRLIFPHSTTPAVAASASMIQFNFSHTLWMGF